MSFFAAFRRLLTFIRFSHTLFALPFALGSFLVASRGWPLVSLGPVCFWIVLAMVFARTAAMAFNRIADWEMDRRNPRTAGRQRLVSFPTAVALCAGSALAFVAVTSRLNSLCFALSPVALGIVFFYSLTKRFTSLCHFFLGLALAVSPVGAWLAVTGAFALPPLLLAAGVTLWTAGFDLIYATQDEAFDRREGLHSLVVRLGVEGALRVAGGLHAGTFLFLLAFGASARLGVAYFATMPLVAVLLVVEHRVARRRDLVAVIAAFFMANALLGLLFVASTLAEALLSRRVG